MSAATVTALASKKIAAGPTRYYLTQALANRHLQIFKIEEEVIAVRIDGLRPLQLDADPCHRWVVTAFICETGETHEWFYDSELRQGSTAIPSA